MQAGSSRLLATHPRSGGQPQQRNNPAFASTSGTRVSSLIPPAGEEGDLPTATLTAHTGSLAAASHLSPVVAWTVAHQLGNQGNNLQRNTEKGCNCSTAPALAAANRLGDTVPGCAKQGPSKGWVSSLG